MRQWNTHVEKVDMWGDRLKPKDTGPRLAWLPRASPEHPGYLRAGFVVVTAEATTAAVASIPGRREGVHIDQPQNLCICPSPQLP
jgi:hypothetical protein